MLSVSLNSVIVVWLSILLSDVDDLVVDIIGAADVHSNSTITFWGNQAGNEANGFRLKSGGTTRHYFWGNDNDQTIVDITGE